MKGSYNPFSKTYQYLCLQQQLAHRNNLKSVKSKKQSNLKVIQPSIFPQKHLKNSHLSRGRTASECSMRRSHIIQPYLTIHKNKPLQSKRQQKRVQENQRKAAKLMNISCSVITRDASLRQYKDHQTYESLARKFCRGGQSKNIVDIDLGCSILSRKSSKYSVQTKPTRKNNQTRESLQLRDQPKYSSYHQDSLKPRYG